MRQSDKCRQDLTSHTVHQELKYIQVLFFHLSGKVGMHIHTAAVHSTPESLSPAF